MRRRSKEDKEKLIKLRDKLLAISEKTDINFTTMDNEELDKWVTFLSSAE